MFDANKEMFDGTMVRARQHPADGDCRQPRREMPGRPAGLQEQVQDKVASGLAKLPANSDALAKEKARTSLMDEEFAALARTKSSCPSKSQGGDVNWFQRGRLHGRAVCQGGLRLENLRDE